MNPKLLALYGLKWNPFTPGVPDEALYISPRLQSFCWRVAQLTEDGGFALLGGAPGAGKSAGLRVLNTRLSAQREIKVGVFTPPQANLSDFYREIGDVFGVELTPHNRWGGAKLLRQRWQAHIDADQVRPVLIIDEAQEMKPAVLAELRLLTSSRLDSQVLLTVVLAGDARLSERLQSEDLLPLTSRIRVRLVLERTSPGDLQETVRHALQQAGAPGLMTPEVIAALCDHAQGNLRALMIMAGDLLDAATEREALRIDETLFFEVFNPAADSRTVKARR